MKYAVLFLLIFNAGFFALDFKKRAEAKPLAAGSSGKTAKSQSQAKTPKREPATALAHHVHCKGLPQSSATAQKFLNFNCNTMRHWTIATSANGMMICCHRK